MTNARAISSMLLERRCLACHYSLQGLTENRCPECGREFDPGNPLTFESPITRHRQRLAYWLPSLLFATCFVTAVIAYGFLLIYASFAVDIEVGHRAWLGGAFALALLTARWARTRARRAILWPLPEHRPGSERAGRWIVGVLAAFIFILISGGIYTYSCPHGWNFRFGPLGATHGTLGGPCHNRAEIIRTWRMGETWYLWIAN